MPGLAGVGWEARVVAGAGISGAVSQILVRRVIGMGSSPDFAAAARWTAG